MTFAEAFAAAHDAGEDTFRWQGKLYTTKRKDQSETKARKQAKAQKLAETNPSLIPPESFVQPLQNPLQALTNPLAQGHQGIMNLLRPPVEAVQNAVYGQNPPDVLGALTQGHKNVVGKLASMNEDYTNKLRRMNQDYTTWNKLRNMLGMPAVQSQFYQGEPNMVDLTSPVMKAMGRTAYGKVR